VYFFLDANFVVFKSEKLVLWWYVCFSGGFITSTTKNYVEEKFDFLASLKPRWRRSLVWWCKLSTKHWL